MSTHMKHDSGWSCVTHDLWSISNDGFLLTSVHWDHVTCSKHYKLYLTNAVRSLVCVCLLHVMCPGRSEARAWHRNVLSRNWSWNCGPVRRGIADTLLLNHSVSVNYCESPQQLALSVLSAPLFLLLVMNLLLKHWNSWWLWSTDVSVILTTIVPFNTKKTVTFVENEEKSRTISYSNCYTDACVDSQ